MVVIWDVEGLPPGQVPAALAAAGRLFSSYRDVLVQCGVPIDEFQGFSDEIKGLPGKYVAEKGGCLLLAVEEGAGGEWWAVGSIAVRDLGRMRLVDEAGEGEECTRVAELKRLYVRAEERGKGVARKLAAAALTWIEGSGLGYDAVVLDTLRRLPGAQHLYETLGFHPCGGYCPNPMEDVVFMRRPAGTRAA